MTVRRGSTCSDGAGVVAGAVGGSGGGVRRISSRASLRALLAGVIGSLVAGGGSGCPLTGCLVLRVSIAYNWTGGDLAFALSWHVVAVCRSVGVIFLRIRWLAGLCLGCECCCRPIL